MMSGIETINGPAGAIELLQGGDAESRRGIVVCHPHPLYGGNMFDGVVDDVCSGAHEAGLAYVRFNFRGVGGSEGTHDQGTGEVSDLMSVMTWLGELTDSTCVAGYSFGAGIASHCAGDVVKILVAPPATMLAEELGSMPVLVIAGELDTIAPPSALEARLQHADNVTLSTIAEADHFFGNGRSVLKREVSDFLTRHL